MWKFEARVETKEGDILKFDGKDPDVDGAIYKGAQFIRQYYKTSWSRPVVQEVDHFSTIYTDGMGVIGYVNAWKES